MKIIDLFKSMARCNLGDGRSAAFWSDLWHSGWLQHTFPQLFSFARDTNISVHTAHQSEYLEDLFHLPLTTQAYQKFQQLGDICDDLRSSDHINSIDTWSYIWGSQKISTEKAYNVLVGVKTVPPQFQWIWKCSCQPKHKILFWMVLHDRVNTRNLLRRKTFYLESYNGALMRCQHEETLFRLFWEGPFVARCWDFVCPNRDTPTSIQGAIQDITNKLGVPFAMEIVILASWAFWISGK